MSSHFPASIMKTNDIYDTKRSLANFHPTIWKEHFLSFTFDDALVKVILLPYFNLITSHLLFVLKFNLILLYF